MTNPAPICTTDGISSGQICNDHRSTVPDDDGGFVRLSGQTYYQSPIALGGAPVMAPAPLPVSPVIPSAPPAANAPVQIELGRASADPGDGSGGQDVTLSQDVKVSDNATLLVDFELYDSQGHQVWQTFHDNKVFEAGASSRDSAVFTIPDSLAPGQYTFKVGIFPAGWGAVYAWNDNAATLMVGGD